MYLFYANLLLYSLHFTSLCNLLDSHLFSVCTVTLEITTLRKIKCTFYKVIVNKLYS